MKKEEGEELKVEGRTGDKGGTGKTDYWSILRPFSYVPRAMI